MQNPQQPNNFFTFKPSLQFQAQYANPQQIIHIPNNVQVQQQQLFPQSATFYQPQVYQTLPAQQQQVQPSINNTVASPSVSTVSSVVQQTDKDKVPGREDFCSNWRSCSETKHHEHKSTKRHLCTIKDCSKTNDRVHVGRFLHNCKYGDKCRKIDDDNHNHNFIHPCKYKGECKKIGDIMHRIFFTHPTAGDKSNLFPSSWGKVSSDHCKRVKLAHTSTEFKDLEKRFIDRVKHKYPTAKVIDIERVENAKLWKSFSTKKSEVIYKNSNTKAEDQVKTLYHGADETAIDSITKSGFDYRLCQVGHYGAGNYFAVNASYSHGYTTAGSDGNFRMLVCEVVVGESLRVSQKDQTLRRPQDKTTGKMYDSVQAGPTGTEYVVFDNESPYPEYVIIYK